MRIAEQSGKKLQVVMSDGECNFDQSIDPLAYCVCKQPCGGMSHKTSPCQGLALCFWRFVLAAAPALMICKDSHAAIKAITV